MRKVFAVLALVAGTSGIFAAVASPASAIPINVGGAITGDTDNIQRICLKPYVRIFGNVILDGSKTCVP